MQQFGDSQDEGFMFALYILFTLTTTLVLLNTLIALMSSVFNEVYLNAENEARPAPPSCMHTMHMRHAHLPACL